MIKHVFMINFEHAQYNAGNKDTCVMKHRNVHNHNNFILKLHISYIPLNLNFDKK